MLSFQSSCCRYWTASNQMTRSLPFEPISASFWGKLQNTLSSITISRMKPFWSNGQSLSLSRFPTKFRVLLSMFSFGRALNDDFMPCRNAALQSFAATIGLFSAQMIARKILPFVMPYTCDSHKSVRDGAFKCIQVG